MYTFKLSNVNSQFLRRAIKPISIIAIVLLLVASLLQATIPVRPYQTNMMVNKNSIGTENQQSLISNNSNTATGKHDIRIRSGLFKPSRRLNTNSITDKTVEKIFNSLKLQCVMTMDGQKVAYIILKDGQMRKCVIGDNVKDMFSVVDIQDESVILDIVGHKLSLTR